jgi:hypothetical protein
MAVEGQGATMWVRGGPASSILSLIVGCVLEVVADLARHGVQYLRTAAPFAFLDRVFLSDFGRAGLLVLILLAAVIGLTYLMEKFAVGWSQKFLLTVALVVTAWIDPYGR